MRRQKISVSSIQSYIIYYGIVCLVFLPSVLFGKRIFCHYFCWMAPFMVLGTKLRKFLHLPGIHIKSKERNKCISCGKCNKVCPMGIHVVSEIRNGVIDNLECIQCGACIDIPVSQMILPTCILFFIMNSKSFGKCVYSGV